MARTHQGALKSNNLRVRQWSDSGPWKVVDVRSNRTTETGVTYPNKVVNFEGLSKPSASPAIVARQRRTANLLRAVYSLSVWRLSVKQYEGQFNSD